MEYTNQQIGTDKSAKQNARVFKIKYLGATDTKGNRVKIIDCRFNKTKTLDRDYEYHSTEQAIDYLEKLGIDIIFKCEIGQYDVLISENFEVALK